MAFAVPAGAEEPIPGQMFESLGQAVEAGVVEPRLAERLYKGETVHTLAVLEAGDAIKAYGDGNPKSLKQSQAMFSEIQTTVIRDLDLPVEERFSLLPVLLTPLSHEDLALRLINHQLVASLWLDGEMELWLTSSLPSVGHPMAVAGGLTGAGTAVAILDTGANSGLPELSRITTSYEAAPDDGSLDDNGHGTGVAGVIAFATPGAQVISVDIMDGTAIHEHDVLRGLSWVMGQRYTHNIRAVNMSFGRDDYHLGSCASTPSPYSGAFQLLRQAGALPIVATGNHAFRTGAFKQGVALPACVPGAIAVGNAYHSSRNTDETWTDCIDKAPIVKDTAACSSASSARLDIFAPGSHVSSARADRNGTSIAAPHVSALAAILASINPYASSQALAGQLTTSSTQIFDSRTALLRPMLSYPDAIRAAAPIPNDNRGSATLLPKWSGRIEQTTWAATTEPGEADHAANDGGASVWFRWIPDRDAVVELSTVGSDFDTLLAAYRVEANGTSTLLDDNNDAGTGVTSIVTIPVHAGETIEIAVDGFRFQGMPFARTGHLRLTWNLPNDDINDAVFVGFGTTTQGTNIGATKQAGEPRHCDDIFSNASVWYQWTPGSPTSTRLQAQGTRLLCVSVYRTSNTVMNPPLNALTLVAAGADDQGDPVDFRFDAQPGNTYWIAVDGVSMETACYPNGQCQYTTPTGPFSLTLSP